jgi:glycosyltransferase involved in cell wall biosynthesis
LAAAAHSFKPDVIHVYWSHFAEQNLGALLATGVRVTIRGHGFDFSPDLIKRLMDRPEIERFYLFPRHAAALPSSSRVTAIPAAVPLERLRPGTKNRTLVLRASAALPTKGLELFVRAAKRLTSFTFVLCLARANDREFEDRFSAFVRKQGNPIDLRFDVPYDECFDLFREAGIYLHTSGDSYPFGMPVSIAQALAAECFTLVRSVPGADEYLGVAGALYRDEDHAVELIEATGAWSEEDWMECREKAGGRARAYDAEAVLDPMYRDWVLISKMSG